MPSSKPRPAASSSGDLPADALYEILLRIPDKELCCLRAVCPSWRVLTYDPHFVAAHKSHHHSAPPLLAIAYRDDSEVSGIDISDLSGNIVKRIPSTGYELVLVNHSGLVVNRILSKVDSISVVRTRLDLVCYNWNLYSRALSVLNPATGATIDLPTGFSEELVHEGVWEGIGGCHRRVEVCSSGLVSSTKEYKVLRVSRIDDRKVCEVITVDDTNHGSWRRKQDPPSSHICTIHKMRCVVVDGVVYFLMDFYSAYCETRVMTIEPGSLALFNLEMQSVLRGPEPVQRFLQENEDAYCAEHDHQLSLAESNGCLVMVNNIFNISMDLWCLTDFEKGVWVKKCSMSSHVARPFRYPFLMLDDGRIFYIESDLPQCLFSAGECFLLSYDPRNDTYTDTLKLRDSKSIGIYTGSLLSL